MTRTPTERRRRSATATRVRRSTWLWVTRSAEPADEGWWSCDPKTRKGDLALVYLTAPASHIAYVARAETNAVPAERDGTPASTTGYRCNYALLERLTTPVPFRTLKGDPALSGWPALDINFNGAAHRIPAKPWRHLLDHAGITPKRLQKLVAAREAEYVYEWQLQTFLEANPHVWRRAGLDLRFVGRQWPFSNGRIADLVYRTRTGRTVVVELKRGRINQKAVDQIRDYQELMRHDHPWRRRPLGILVGQPPRPEVLAAIRRARRLRFVDVADLGLSPHTSRPRRRRGRLVVHEGMDGPRSGVPDRGVDE